MKSRSKTKFVPTQMKDLFAEELRANQQYGAAGGGARRPKTKAADTEKCCRTCKLSDLMRRGLNPIIAQCRIDGERQVANYYYCSAYCYTEEEKVVRQL